MRREFLSGLFLGLAVLASCKTSDDDPSAIKVVADERGYTPSRVVLKRGQPGRVQFKLTTEQTCAREVVIPDLKIDKRLPLDEPVVIEIPTSEPRTFPFECGMAMFKGTIVVE